MEETVIYLIRHSEAMTLNNYDIDSEQLINEKRPLTVRGEELAKEESKNKELTNLDLVYSSPYVRAICSAKYIAYNNGVELSFDKRIGERIVGQRGSMEWRDFERMQHKDFDYRLPSGESINQVNKRMSSFLKEILNNNEGKRIAIVAHGACIVSLLINWCDKGYNFDGNLILDYKGVNIYDGDIKPMQIYKLRFEGLKLLTIERI